VEKSGGFVASPKDLHVLEVHLSQVEHVVMSGAKKGSKGEGSFLSRRRGRR